MPTVTLKELCDALPADIREKMRALIDRLALEVLEGVTASAAEINKLDAVEAGTAAASKAAVLGTNKNLDEFHTAALYLGATAGTLVAATAAQLNALAHFPGRQSVGVIDFNATGTAAMTITINSVVYQEADAENLPNGVWTNGASAANSATSLAAAINGDTRSGGSPFTAIVSAEGNSVVIMADAIGTAGNVAVASSQATATVDNPTAGGLAAAIKQVVVLKHTVTARDVLAAEINIPLPWAASAWLIQYLDGNGVLVESSDQATLATAPHRVKVLQAGATHMAAGGVVQVVAWN